MEVSELCRFLGIVIAMFYREHGPPHFHAVYGEFDITVEIETGIVNGKFPKRALTHVLEWHGLHQEELMDNWLLVQERKPLKQIQPLKETDALSSRRRTADPGLYSVAQV